MATASDDLSHDLHAPLLKITPETMPQTPDALATDGHELQTLGQADPQQTQQTQQTQDLHAQEAIELTLAEVARGSGYAPEAFAFLQRGLANTVDLILADEDEPRHIGGGELCEGLRDFALDQWGAMAGFVLGRWGVTSTNDFGAMVYHLVAHDVLSTSDQDQPDDFDDVFDFSEFDDYRIDI